jgi:hypothetical protein
MDTVLKKSAQHHHLELSAVAPSMCREVTFSAAGDEGHDDVRSVAIEVLSASAVDAGGARVRVTGSELDVAKQNAGVECGHDERSAQHVRVHVAETGSFAERSHPAVSGAPVETLAVASSPDRALVAFPDGALAS